MYILTPHMSCVISEQEFEEALKTYSDIYIVSGMGKILRHIKLRGGRYIRIEVKEIPGLDKELLEPEIKEEINFLPNGKIPSHLLLEIVQFFREVMTVKKAEQEAMAHILWHERDKDNTDKGYRIAIPNQTVGKASVRYEHDHIESGDVIVLDIHSHNTMGAFFSGTDDNDDKKGIFFSGVTGNLDRIEPAFTWRLNINEVKRECKITDIFDILKVETTVPSEWLEKVKTQSWEPYSPGKSYTPAGGWAERNSRSGSNAISGGMQGTNHSRESYHAAWEGGCPDLYEDTEFAPYRYGLGHSESYDPSNLPASTKEAETTSGSSSSEGSVESPVVINKPSILPPARIKAISSKGVVVENVIGQSQEYSYHASEFGKEAAESYDQITAYLGDLEEKDELLLNIMAMTFQLLSFKGQEKLGREGIK